MSRTRFCVAKAAARMAYDRGGKSAAFPLLVAMGITRSTATTRNVLLFCYTFWL